MLARNIIRFIGLSLMNYSVLFFSSNANVYQFFLDLEKIKIISEFNELNLYILISLSVPVLCLFLIYFFRPFIEIYLLHFIKFNFYLLINLLSVSTIYIVFRIYGYDRINMLIYLLIASLFLYKTDNL
jgi:hypothetical protein